MGEARNDTFSATYKYSNQILLLRLIHSVGIHSVGRQGATTKKKEKKKILVHHHCMCNHTTPFSI